MAPGSVHQLEAPVGALFELETEHEFRLKSWQIEPAILPTPSGMEVPSLAEVEDVLATVLSATDVTLARTRDGRLERRDCPAQGAHVDRYEIARLFADGWSLVANAVASRSAGLAAITARFEQAFCVPFGINVYVTPEGAQGFREHVDSHDVFIIPVAGTKRWDVYEQAIDRPLPGMGVDDETTAEALSYQVGPGDCLYIPRGWRHRAVAESGVTAHLTVGCRAIHKVDAVERLVAEAARRDPRLRDMMTNDDIERFDGDHARELLESIIGATEAVADSVRSGLRRQFSRATVAPRFDLLSVASQLDDLDLDSVLRHRPGAAPPRVESTADTVTISFHTNEVRGPIVLDDAMRFAAATSEFRIREFPAPLSDSSRMVLARRLVREGILTTNPPPGEDR